jgi:hypothetical protein
MLKVVERKLKLYGGLFIATVQSTSDEGCEVNSNDDDDQPRTNRLRKAHVHRMPCSLAEFFPWHRCSPTKLLDYHRFYFKINLTLVRHDE